MNDDSDKDIEEDDELFKQAMRDVSPLKPDNKIRHKPTPRRPAIRRPENNADEFPERFSEDLFEQECPDQLSFERDGGAQKSVLKKLRQGKLAIDGTLDLHGLTVAQARQQLIAFMAECRQFGYRHVVIIHGKGYRSQNKAVIKPMLNRWLSDAEEVLAFCSAQPKHGGTGAVYVLLRKIIE